MEEDLKCGTDFKDKKKDSGGIRNSIITVNNFSFAYVIHSSKSNAQSNAVVIVAGKDVDAEVKNDVDLEKND